MVCHCFDSGVHQNIQWYVIVLTQGYIKEPICRVVSTHDTLVLSVTSVVGAACSLSMHVYVAFGKTL